MRKPIIDPVELERLAEQGLSMARLRIRFKACDSSIRKVAQVHGIKLVDNKDLRRRYGLPATRRMPSPYLNN
jgi:hypothetical protein